MPRRKKPAAPPDQQICAACGETKPLHAFRLLPGGTRQDTCRRCRPALPLPAWKATEIAETQRRRGAIRAAAERRAAKARETVPWPAANPPSRSES